MTIKFVDFTFGHPGSEPLAEPYSDFWGGNRYLVIGSNGVGKTTLLATLAGLLAPKQGSVQLVSRDDNHPEKVLVSSHVALPGDVPLEYIVKLAIKRGTPTLEARLRDLLEVFTLTLKGKTFGDLSLGSKQKFRIALGLFREPQFLLLDECYSSLDDNALEELTCRMNDYPHTIIHATHEIRSEANWERVAIRRNRIERVRRC